MKYLKSKKGKQIFTFIYGQLDYLYIIYITLNINKWNYEMQWLRNVFIEMLQRRRLCLKIPPTEAVFLYFKQLNFQHVEPVTPTSCAPRQSPVSRPSVHCIFPCTCGVKIWFILFLLKSQMQMAPPNPPSHPQVSIQWRIL